MPFSIGIVDSKIVVIGNRTRIDGEKRVIQTDARSYLVMMPGGTAPELECERIHCWARAAML